MIYREEWVMKSYTDGISLHKQVILSKLDDLGLVNSLVYVAGSLMGGFGNATSDVDIYEVCEESHLDKQACKSPDSESLYYVLPVKTKIFSLLANQIFPINMFSWIVGQPSRSRIT